MARRLGTPHDAEAARDLFQSKTKDPLVDALGFVGRHLDEAVRQSGREITAAGRHTHRHRRPSEPCEMARSRARRAPCLACCRCHPMALVKSAAEQRNILLSEQLPDALDLVSRSPRRDTESRTRCAWSQKRCQCRSRESSAASTKRTISTGLQESMIGSPSEIPELRSSHRRECHAASA